MAKTLRPATAAKPQVFFENGCIVIRQMVVCGEKPTVNVFLNNRAVPKSSKYATDIAQDGLGHIVTFHIKEVTIM